MLQLRMLFLASLFPFVLFAQTDTATRTGNIFDILTREMETYKPDTSLPPKDKITSMIMELRELKGGFNINEAIEFKIAEDRNKGEMPPEEIDRFQQYFTLGRGKVLLDNAVTWIYRHHFTYKELKSLVNFYRSSAGQKMATQFPVVMLKSLAAAEMIKQTAIK